MKNAVAGGLGFEPKQTESEPVGLPLAGPLNATYNQSDFRVQAYGFGATNGFVSPALLLV